MKPFYRTFLTSFSLKDTVTTLAVLFIGLLITFISVFYSWMNMKNAAKKDFEFSCNEIAIKIATRLNEHGQLLRAGAGLFGVSDTVTREEWRKFNELTNISKYLPGIEGFGYAHLIYPNELEEHIRFFRKNGFPDYTVYPEGKREIYSSIIYLEPFSGRNLAAFGYDMFSEPVRKKAMQMAVDSNYARLSGKVTLVQESARKKGEVPQAGVLMYVPVYKREMVINTMEERQAAIRGWVYSPYRMSDLMSGIRRDLNLPEEHEIHFKIFDDDLISEESLMYDSYLADGILSGVMENMSLIKSVVFNGTKWTLVFSGRKDEISIFHTSQILILICGIIISLLLFFLSMMQINANVRTREIQHLNDKLEKLNNDKDRFIAVLSHDLKSPFTSILGFLDFLTEDIHRFTINEIKQHTNIINDAAKNFYNLLEDLLMWTRAHSGNIPFNPKTLRLKDIYDNVMEIVHTAAESKYISVIYTGKEDVNIYADPDMLKAVLRNLISNSIKFTKPGGTIKISTEDNNGSTTVTVADTGVGIKPDRLEKLFDFSMIQSTSGTSNEKGSGLGLILCKEFIEKHGGKIEVSSEYGIGSEFRFTLPGKFLS